jgi:hypothetical protein
MKFFVTVMFLINGEWTLIEGYHPMEVPDKVTCDKRVDFMEGVLQHSKDDTAGFPDFKTTCLVVEEGEEPVDVLLKFYKEQGEPV